MTAGYSLNLTILALVLPTTTETFVHLQFLDTLDGFLADVFSFFLLFADGFLAIVTQVGNIIN